MKRISIIIPTVETVGYVDLFTYKSVSKLQKYIPFFVSAMLMCIVLVIIYPHYQYYIDPDGTAYLTISQRYADGDFAKAVNGYWSPWSCWLTAIFIKAGLAAIPASVVINAFGAAGFLFISQSFFLRFDIARNLQWLMNVALALFLCYAIFWQSFDDLWECFFLLSTLRIMLVEGFKSKPGLWVLCGVVGALAYFAKAYSFPFFILNTVCCTYFLSKDNKVQWIKISLVAIVVMVLCSMPWIIALHSKYGKWTTSTAGSLNMSWYLVGHPYWEAGIQHLIPPFYKDSPSYWEDPYWANGSTPHFWDSLSLLGDQVIRAGYHVLLFLLSVLQLSFFFPLILIVAFLSMVLKKGKQIFTSDMKVVILSFLLFPLGYLLVNFESRYLWYMLPLSMVMGALIIQQKSFNFRLSAKALAVVFSVSYLLIPAWGLFRLYDQGKQEFDFAQRLKSANIRGSFTGNIRPAVMTRLAYFSGCQYYFLLNEKWDIGAGLFDDMRRHNIDYYFHYNLVNSGPDLFTDRELFEDSAFISEHKEQLSEIKVDTMSSIKVFKIVR